MSGIPAFVTESQKAALRARGLSAEDIRNIKPEEAQKILNGGGAPPQPNRDEAERFLNALDPSPDARWCFQTFTDDKKARRERAEENKRRKQQGKPPLKDPLAAWRYGTLDEHYNWLVKQNTRGAGIYVTINETDSNGRKETNITRIRALFIDLDGAPLQPVANVKVKPHIVIQSSPGRFQGYWSCTGRMPFKAFEPLQKALADRFNGDPAVSDLPRVMRVPGFIHRKENDKPFLSHIVAINDSEPYRASFLLRTFRPPKQIREEKPKQPNPRQPVQPAPDDELRQQWKKLNTEAIRRYSDWVPDIFPRADKTSVGGYRVTSAELGRNNEEDLSFHTNGIVDWGVHDLGDPRRGRRTPIDILEQYLKKDFKEAVRWLAEKLGLEPQDYLPKPKVNGQGSGDAATDAEISRLAKLSIVQYEREREAVAKTLGIRVGTLDKLVTNQRTQQAYAKKAPAAKTAAARLLAEMNRDNCVVLDGARTRVLRFEENEHDAGGEHYVYRVPTFLRFEDFRNLYLNRHIMVGNRSVDAGSWWLEHPQRLQYPGIIFKPNGAHIINGKLNLWGGWGVTPRRGDWGLMREHIFEVCAARDAEVDEYIINWLAWALQHADEQPEAALVFMGDRGTGRGTLGKALCKIFGQHAHHISSPVHLTGRFNAHLRQVSFLFADEAYAPGDKSAEGTLKRLITEPTLDIEPKGRDVVTEPNRLHAMFASNEDWVVPAGPFERRYVVQEVANTYRQDKTWFGPIYEQLRSGGYEAMAFDLLERDLGDWHPRDIVRTAALAAQQEQSLSPFDAWWFEVLQTGVIPGSDPLKPDHVVSNRYEEEVTRSTAMRGSYTRTVRHEGLYDQARRSSPKLKGETDAAFGRYLGDEQRGAESCWVRRHRGWKFPALSVCREHWLKRFPQTRWRDPAVKEWKSEG
jgi:uncharacterized protein DUF5906/DNA primase RepB-like protein